MNYVQPFIYSFEERGGNEIIENREMREMGNFDAEDFICSFCETDVPIGVELLSTLINKEDNTQNGRLSSVLSFNVSAPFFG